MQLRSLAIKTTLQQKPKVMMAMLSDEMENLHPSKKKFDNLKLR
jgi:hypothetical protein